MGGQRIPRTARLLLFGRNHCEVDLKGSFYELVRRLGLLFMPDHVPILTIDDLRGQLYRDPYIQAVEALCPHTVKQLVEARANVTERAVIQGRPAHAKPDFN